MDKCIQCGHEIEQKGNRKRVFCSDKCRKAYKRANPDIQSGQNEGQSGQNLNPDTPKILSGQELVEIVSRPVEIVMGDVEGLLTPAMLDSLPPSVVKPTGQPTGHTAALTGRQLSSNLTPMKVWQVSAEYAETIYRLLTIELDDLLADGQAVPGWRYLVA